MEIKWSIKNLEVFLNKYNLQNIVHKIYWKLEVIEDTYIQTKEGVEEIIFNENGNFIAFENLTEQQVIEWVKNNCLGKEKAAYFETELLNNIEKLKNPETLIVDVPWI